MGKPWFRTPLSSGKGDLAAGSTFQPTCRLLDGATTARDLRREAPGGEERLRFAAGADLLNPENILAKTSPRLPARLKRQKCILRSTIPSPTGGRKVLRQKEEAAK